MTESILVRDLAVVLAVGAAVTAVFHRLHQPAVLGYLLAGMVIGPHTPPFALIRDVHSIETMAELGMILLLFSIGLEFSLRKLRRVGGVASLCAALEVPFMIWLGYSAGSLAGWSRMDSLFLGAILSISSTTIIAKALLDLGLTQQLFARIILGVLILEDLAAIVILVLLTGLARAGTVELGDLVAALGSVGLFVSGVTVLGLLLVPRMIRWIARLPAREVLTVGVLGLCFSSAILAAELGFSPALGAFLIGAVIAESRHAHTIEQRIEPIRDMFSAIFFVAVGLQIDPAAIVEDWSAVLVLSALTIAGKVGTCALGAILAGYPAQTALRVGMGLGQIGEFSFIIANLGVQVGVISSFIYTLTVAVSAVTTLSTPYQIRYAERVSELLGRVTPTLLRSFVRFYGEQFGAAGTKPGWQVAKEALRPLAGGVLSFTLLIGLLLAAKIALQVTRRRLGQPLLFDHDLEVLVLAGAGMFSLPLVFALWQRGTELADVLSARIPSRAASRRILAETFRFAFVLVVAVLFLLIASPMIPSGIPLIVTLVLVALATVLFWRSVLRVQVRAEEVLRRAFSEGPDETEIVPEDRRRQLIDLVSAKYPFEVMIEDVILPLHATAVNRSVREIGLRSETGATIAAIYRGDGATVNPDPETTLLPGDVILLLGSPAQISRAIRYLAALSADQGP